MLGFYAAFIGSFATDVSAETIIPTLNGQAVQKEAVADRLPLTAIALWAAQIALCTTEQVWYSA